MSDNDLIETKLCDRDAEFARKAAFIWAHDMVWRDTLCTRYRIRDLDDRNHKLGQRWVKYAEIEFV
jgi:hypothetical protein